MIWKDHQIYKLKNEKLSVMQDSKENDDIFEDLSDMAHIIGMNSETLMPQDKATHVLNLHKDKSNWDEIFINQDKFSGSLRYTFDKEDAEHKKFKLLFKNLTQIEIHENKIEGFYVADLIYENKKKPVQKQRLCRDFSFTPKSQAIISEGEKVNDEKEQEGPDDTSETAIVKSRKVIAQIRCETKLAMQWIQIALDEAMKDFREVGRPLTLIIHESKSPSMLSSLYDEYDSRQAQLKGIINLLVLLLVVNSVRNVLKSLQRHGFQLGKIFMNSLDSAEQGMAKEQYQTLLAILFLFFFIFVSFLIETVATYNVNRYIISSMVILNMIVIFVYPLYVSFVIKGNATLSAFIMMQATVMILKMISYHHTMYDVRYLVAKAAKAKKEDKTLKPSKIEGTIMGVDQKIFEEAMTYPKCHKFSSFTRFILAPTFCYQLKYPTNDQIDWFNLIKYLFQCIVCGFLMIYLIFQHMLPIAVESTEYFQKRDYMNILIQTLGMAVPGTYFWLVLFYALFHAFPNFTAELTQFGDRRFYADWWNAGNLAEYWRKWNYPIHNWLVRHVYFPLKRRGYPDEVCKFLTFTVSAVAHEYICVGAFRVFNMIAFAFMMINVPLMTVQKAVFTSNMSRNFNNITFWVGYTVIGQPFAMLIVYFMVGNK